MKVMIQHRPDLETNECKCSPFKFGTQWKNSNTIRVSQFRKVWEPLLKSTHEPELISKKYQQSYYNNRSLCYKKYKHKIWALLVQNDH